MGRFQDATGDGLELHLQPTSTIPTEGGEVDFNTAGKAYVFDQSDNAVTSYEVYGTFTPEVVNLRLIKLQEPQSYARIVGKAGGTGYELSFSANLSDPARTVTLTAPGEIRGRYTLGEGVLSGGTDNFSVVVDLVDGDGDEINAPLYLTLQKANADGSFSGACVDGFEASPKELGTVVMANLSFPGFLSVDARYDDGSEFSGTFYGSDISQPGGVRVDNLHFLDPALLNQGGDLLSVSGAAIKLEGP